MAPARIRGEFMRRYKVERDTMVGAERAFVVAVRTTSTVEVEVRDPRMRLLGDVTGIELGFVVITEQNTRMLSRTRSGRAEGAMRAVAGSQRVEVPLKMEYRSGLALRPAAAR